MENRPRVGEIVVDLAQGVPLQVVEVAHRSAGEHPQVTVDEETRALWGVTEDERVYDCVFLPTEEDRVDAPSNTYAYPAGRLARVPVEQAVDGDARRIPTQIVIEFLADVLADCRRADQFDVAETLLDAVGESSAPSELSVSADVLVGEVDELADAKVGPGGGA
jgi:hypothetical protein